MAGPPVGRLLSLGGAILVLAACGLVVPGREPDPPAGQRRPAPVRAERLPEKFESNDFIVTFARRGDTPESLAARYLGDRGKAWMIEDFNGVTRLEPGQQVVIPRRAWNPSGVGPSGFQLVPVLVYHNIAPQAKGRLVMAASTFEEQMRYLKEQGYRVVSLDALYDFLAHGRQLPRKSVVVTFDDGYRSFLEHVRPVLKALGFTATLFVYTDYIDRGGNALTWEELAELAAEGFQVEGHSKTHGDLRRRPGEAEDEYARRLKAEIEGPQRTFEQRLGRAARFFAYPYGGVDDSVIEHVRSQGFLAGLTVFREGNSSFVPLYRVRRSQIYADMTLEDFARILDTFAGEPIK